MKKQKLLRNNGCQNNIGEAEDRISELPDSLLHHILSFLKDIRHVARTAVLSKRWGRIWTCIPTLVLAERFEYSEIDKYMNFVDRTLLLHDSSIQKIHIYMDDYFDASRVHSWISNAAKHDVKDLSLSFVQHEPFSIPLCLCTCQSLITLEITAIGNNILLPKKFSSPNLKSLTLSCVEFNDEKNLFNFPVLENLVFTYCTWFEVRNFSISAPALKRLKIDYVDDDGLQDCAFKINAPNLVSLDYRGNLAKEYDLSSFQKLESANFILYGYDGYAVRTEKSIGIAVSKLFQAVAHVQSLTISAGTLEVLSRVRNLVNVLPMFHNLEKLVLNQGETIDNYKLLFSFLKAAPNLSQLVFDEGIWGNNEKEEEGSWDGHMLTGGSLFQHLRSVCFVHFSAHAREMRWLELILKNAKAMQTVTIGSYANHINAKTKQRLMSEFPRLPKASSRCVILIVPK